MEIEVLPADYADATHAAALVQLLDAYAADPAGGGQGLSEFTRSHLVRELAARPQAFSVLAFDRSGQADAAPVGLVNCLEGFSTFACRPLVNVHDLAVMPAWRGKGVGRQMLALVESLARARGACKLTLEVLAGNRSAMNLYRRCGFDGYQLDPSMGSAQFLQKWLD
ncbi:MAG: GNAT family N-acetyltransferase [Burkholderiaceae bacterium]|nr:GNAT family N-acetyltransferase [Burkholderiaceae bacterium]